MRPHFFAFSPPGRRPPPPPRSRALQSTSKCLISVESGAQGIIDHAESLHIHGCTEGGVMWWSKKPHFQRRAMITHLGCLFIFLLFQVIQLQDHRAENESEKSELWWSTFQRRWCICFVRLLLAGSKDASAAALQKYVSFDQQEFDEEMFKKSFSLYLQTEKIKSFKSDSWFVDFT